MKKVNKIKDIFAESIREGQVENEGIKKGQGVKCGGDLN